ncbi:MAG: tetratricopeptide repeat protein [Burkholderiales bacterium]
MSNIPAHRIKAAQDSFFEAFQHIEQGDWKSAENKLKKSLKFLPGHIPTLTNLSAVLVRLKQHDEARKIISGLLQSDPDNPEAILNLGLIAAETRQYQEAIDCYGKAIALNPHYAEAYSNRGDALAEIKQLDAAVTSYDQAIQINPDYAEAYANRGYALKELNQLDAAIASFEKSFRLKPDQEFLFGAFLNLKMHVCDWENLDQHIADLNARIKRREKASAPFELLAISDSPETQKLAAENWVQAKCPANRALGPISGKKRGGKIRIGYYSADYHDHATAFLMANLFEVHDKSRFELIGFSFGPGNNDPMRKRISAAFDSFMDVRAKSDLDVASLSREIGIDIAVDLKGLTQDSRPGIFAARCAPVQVNYLGYPGSMGASYIDYIIADKMLIPDESRRHYSEKIVCLPHSYQVNDPKREISERTYTREDCGLPRSGFVFCCFNNNYKITPATFDVWMRLLGRIEHSVLWLFEGHPTAARNLKKEAERRGINGQRLIFAERMPLAEHLARHRLADLFVDTLPCNAHTTASDALWAGLPVLTLMGTSFASRVAGSLLNGIGLPELITRTREEYETRAMELATNTDKMAGIREKLAKNRLEAPLFDCQTFARNIEAAYATMHDRHHNRLAPDHIDIK